MNKTIITLIIILLIISTSCQIIKEQKPNDNDRLTKAQAQQIARAYAEKTPTYQFDGEGLKLIKTEEEKDRVTFTYSFTSKHGGYGDRTGKIVTQAITPHEMRITVITKGKDKGTIKKATIDNKWDATKQEMINHDEY